MHGYVSPLSHANRHGRAADVLEEVCCCSGPKQRSYVGKSGVKAVTWVHNNHDQSHYSPFPDFQHRVHSTDRRTAAGCGEMGCFAGNLVSSNFSVRPLRIMITHFPLVRRSLAICLAAAADRVAAGCCNAVLCQRDHQQRASVAFNVNRSSSSLPWFRCLL